MSRGGGGGGVKIAAIRFKACHTAAVTNADGRMPPMSHTSHPARQFCGIWALVSVETFW